MVDLTAEEISGGKKQLGVKNKEFKLVLLYLGIVLFLSYFVFWGPIALFKIETANLTQGTTGPIWALILFILGGFVPSIVGIAFTAFLEGKPGIKKLFRSSINVKIGLKSYLLILLVSIFYGGSLILINTILGGKFDYSQFWLQLITIIPLIILGPLSEEYGWRGFALKQLLKNNNSILASFIIGLGWSLWHLPLFFMLGTSQYAYQLPFLTFLLTVTSSSFIYTYIYIKTKKSLFSAIILHWIWTYIMQVIASTVARSSAYNWLEAAPAILLGIIFILLLRYKKGLPK